MSRTGVPRRCQAPGPPPRRPPTLSSRRARSWPRSRASGVASRRATPSAETVFELQDMSVTYSGSYAVQGVNMSIRKNEITALIGPSGCGKTTVLRCLNRTNDLIQGAKVHGRRPLPRASTCTVPRSSRWRSAGASAWSSRSRTRSPSRSTTTSPSGPGSAGSRATWTSWSSGRCAGPRSGTR